MNRSLTAIYAPIFVIVACVLSQPHVAGASPVDFATTVKPIFEKHCVTCHDANNHKGGFSLADAPSAMRGGDSGPVIEPGKPAESILLEMVSGKRPEMPPKGDKLTKQQVAAIRDWIKAGAAWPKGVTVAESHLRDRSWWSFKPLKKPAPPSLDTTSKHAGWPRNTIDRFVLHRLEANRLAPSPEADRRTLIRRVYFDLVGLPPEPEAIRRFVAADRPDAYERLVNELLASPRYGERWARHWLDVVHYADTHGYDKDKPRPNAWPYRDYVIRALNSDKPWSRFVQEQIAGDVLFPGTRDGIEALGFISAGPWDYVGHAEVPESKIDGKIARHLDRDDMVRATMQSFTSLTVGCAQCHDHKFDPVTQEDYYKLQAVFAAVDRADQRYDRDPATRIRRDRLERELREAEATVAATRSAASARAASSLNKIDAQLIALGQLQLKAVPADRRDAVTRLLKEAKKRSTSNGKPKRDGNPAAFGYHSRVERGQNTAKWVQVDLGKPTPISRIALRPCKDNYNNIGEGFGFPVRFKVEISNDPAFAESAIMIADQTARDFANPKLASVSYAVNGEPARYVRVTATRLAPRRNDFIFALAELEVFNREGVNRAVGKPVTALDSIEAPVRWQKKNLTDGYFLGDPEHVRRLKAERDQLIVRAMTDAERQQWQAAERLQASHTEALAAMPKQAVAYIGAVHHGRGNFKGTGNNGGKPRPIHVLRRGDVKAPGKLVAPGALAAFDLDPKHFVLSDGHGEGARRAALARWLTDRENPLPWRSVVNRVWLHHFGRGIVDTPNDFGRMGGRPSHPELIDWLAAEFRDGEQSLKALHRLIVTSATYRQRSVVGDSDTSRRATAIDANNRLLWRMNRRKLEAEAVRDSVLQVSGKLDLTMGGPGYRDFVLNRPQHSPHYDYHLHDPDDAKTHRRAIYRFIVRSQLQPFMNTLDCADPSMLVGKRNQSLTPLQSLTMLNNGLMVTMAKHFAARLERSGGSTKDKVTRGFEQAIGRKPDSRALATLVAVAEKHGLANACRILFNMNEFSYVD